MKNKVKKSFRLVFALIAISLLFTTCEKENTKEEIQAETQEPALIFKRYSIQDIEKNTKLTSRLKKFNDKLIENKSAKTSAKTVYNSDYDFTIYTDAATYIENGDYHSYTFPLVQDADEKMSNVLFELNDQGEYDAYLVRYDYSANEFNTLDLNTLSLVTSMKPIDLDFDSLSAKTYAYYVCVYSYNYVDTGELMGAGNEVYEWLLTAEHCEWVYHEVVDGTTYNNNTTTVTIGGTNYGGTGGSQTSPTPSPYDGEELLKINAVKAELNLNPILSQWIDQNGWAAFQLYDFLTEEMWSEEAKAFGKSAVVALYGGGEMDLEEQVILDSTFEDNNKTKCTYQILTENINFKELIENFTGEESPTLKFQIISDLECNGATNPTGCTRSELESNNSITISIDQEYIDSNQTPTLFIMRTIIHEAIHANMYLALYNEENGNTINLPDINDFPAIYEQYRLMENAQHEFMAQNYTNLIAQILQEIHPLLNDQTFIDILNNDYPNMTLAQFYTSISFLGLNETVGQTNYLNDPVNSDHYNISFYAAQTDSTKTPNCN